MTTDERSDGAEVDDRFRIVGVVTDYRRRGGDGLEGGDERWFSPSS